VAEFVQDEPTLRLLRELGVDYVQGYLIGRPSPVEAGRLRTP
jgi:EAL domain-containing protein (putative c-di-GMP-specific phosphodiesterase class I)